MKDKLKRIIAIIGLVFMILGSIFLVIYMFNQSALNNSASVLAFIFLGLGVLSYFSILLTKGFPFQQQKEEERKRLESEYEKKMQEDSSKDD